MKSKMISTEHIMNADVYVDNDRVITPEEVDDALHQICRKKFHIIEGLTEKAKKSYNKFIASVFLGVMLEEMKKSYYCDVSNVMQIININSDTVFEDGKPIYGHVENLCIWQNGFYQFNSFNYTTPSMGKPSQKTISSSSK